MTIGQPFNPYRMFVGSFIPNWVMIRKEISQGAKLCYARLMQYAGDDGKCFPKQDTLGEEMGVGDRQVRGYLSELEELGLIRTTQPGMGKPNFYEFLWHQWSDDCQTGSTVPVKTGRRLPPRPEEDFRPDRKNSSGPTVEENHLRGSSKRINGDIDVMDLIPPGSFLSNNIDFLEAWADWVEYKREKRKSLKPSTVKEQIKWLEKQGDCQTVIKIIRQSIRNGWDGLFEDKSRSQANKTANPTPNFTTGTIEL